METIVSTRIRSSRIQRGYSLQEVADKVGVTKQMINKYEKGDSMPTSDKLIAFSKLFGQKVDYFFRKPEVEIGEINFRKKSKFSNKKVKSLKEEIRVQIENYLYIENICNLNSTFVNPLTECPINSKSDIIDATEVLRKAWNIGNDTIHNIIQLLEDKEIKVIEVEEETNLFDGLATVVDEKYYVIVINKSMPIERKRFTILHELGHLLLNLNHLSEKEQESFCHTFASEMLLAQRNVLVEFGEKRSSIAFNELKNIQEKYGISISAIMYKLGELGIISQDKLSSFYKSLNFNPAKKKEVEESRYEGEENSTKYENLVYRAVSEEFISLSKASSLLQLSLEELKNSISINIR
jgi:Zn-dependent peptidase ImmA (M78 family)/DNA-binding XRE family transcriptional regulator